MGTSNIQGTLEEHRKVRERKRRAECDDPRVAVGPSVSSERGAWAPAETKCKAMRHGVKSLRESWRRAECAPGRTQGERGPPKATAVAWFFAPEIGRTPFRVSRKMATLRPCLPGRRGWLLTRGDHRSRRA